MKKSEIVVGGIYTNWKGKRIVLGRGNQYKNFQDQYDCDCVQYRQLEGREKGKVRNMTTQRFAEWAKERAK